MQRLLELGWIEGRNIAIEYRWAEGRAERAAEIAAEFARLKVDVIVGAATPPRLRQSRRRRLSRSVRGGGRPGRHRPSREVGVTGGNIKGCRFRRPILPASGLKFCARSSPVSAGWQSWAMSAIPQVVLEMG